MPYDLNVAFLPSSKEFLSNKILTRQERDNCNEPFIKLRSFAKTQGININTYDIFEKHEVIDILILTRYEVNLLKIFRILRKNKNAKIILLITEELSVAPLGSKAFTNTGLFDKVLTWRPEDLDSKKYIHYFYPNPLRIYKSPINFESKKFITIINSFKRNTFNTPTNLYEFRIEMINFFSDNSSIDLYGFGWNKCKSLSPNVKYCGQVTDKIEILYKYKYALIIENSSDEAGAISEKIFDAFSAGCVPIYLGAPDISLYIPENTYINFKHFKNNYLLLNFLERLSRYQYLNYQNEIQKFMNSKSYKSFTSEAFAKKIVNLIKKLKLPGNEKSIALIKVQLLKNLFKDFFLHLKYKRLFVDTFLVLFI